MVTTYYQQAHGIIMVYDISSRESFDGLNFWKDIIEEKCSKETKILLIGNKSDLETIREISTKEGEELAEKHGYFFMETSAKKNLEGEVGRAFDLIINHLARKEIQKLTSDTNSEINAYQAKDLNRFPPEEQLKKKNCC